MNEPKKTEVITFRTTKQMKDYLEEMSKLNHWSIAQVVFAIIHNYIVDDKPNSIIVKAKDFYEYVKSTETTMEADALEISIFNYENDEKNTHKYIVLDKIECGGAGLVSNDESLIEMTEEEILDIP